MEVVFEKPCLLDRAQLVSLLLLCGAIIHPVITITEPAWLLWWGCSTLVSGVTIYSAAVTLVGGAVGKGWWPRVKLVGCSAVPHIVASPTTVEACDYISIRGFTWLCGWFLLFVGESCNTLSQFGDGLL